jgi:hypothetical protein
MMKITLKLQSEYPFSSPSSFFLTPRECEIQSWVGELRESKVVEVEQNKYIWSSSYP